MVTNLRSGVAFATTLICLMAPGCGAEAVLYDILFAAAGQGASGEDGADGQDGQPGAPGLACYDLNGNGVGDPEEDINGDGEWTAIDCQGARGPRGPAGPPGRDGSDGSDAGEGGDDNHGHFIPPGLGNDNDHRGGNGG